MAEFFVINIPNFKNFFVCPVHYQYRKLPLLCLLFCTKICFKISPLSYGHTTSTCKNQTHMSSKLFFTFRFFALILSHCWLAIIFSQNAKRNMIGYFADKETDSYKTFRRVALQLRDDCGFHSAIGYGTKPLFYHDCLAPCFEIRMNHCSTLTT